MQIERFHSLKGLPSYYWPGLRAVTGCPFPLVGAEAAKDEKD